MQACFLHMPTHAYLQSTLTMEQPFMMRLAFTNSNLISAETMNVRQRQVILAGRGFR